MIDGWMGRTGRAPVGWRGSVLLCPWGAGIKALHINTITKEEETKEKRKDMKRWKMTCGPFISPRAMLPSLTISFFFVSCLPFSLSASIRPSSSLCTFSPLFCLNELKTASSRDQRQNSRKMKTHVRGDLDNLTCTCF